MNSPVVECGPGLRVLVVEDDPNQRASLVDLLSQEGLEPVGCGTGFEAVQALEVTTFSLAVVDLRLPDIDGAVLVRELRHLDSQLRIIVNTAFGTFESARDLLNLGVHGLFEKGGDPGDLLRRVHEAMSDRMRAYATGLEESVAAHTTQLEVANRALRDEIAQREVLESERQSNERRYQAVFNAVPSCIHEIDSSGNVVAMNPAGLRMLGLQREEQVLGVPYLDLVGKRNRARVQASLLEAWAGRGSKFEFQLGEGDGTRYFRSRVEPCLRDSGATERLIGQTEEITEAVRAEARRAELERQLRHSQKLEALGTLASGVAHDFNNVLTAVLGYAELLEHAVGNDPLTNEGVEGIRQAAEQAVEVTRALLTFGGKSSEEHGPVDLEALVRRAVRLLRHMLPDSVSVSMQLGSLAGSGLVGDRGQLSQVLMNLAVNARDSMPDGGQLRIELERRRVGEELWAVLRVSDEGQGMPEEVRERMFEPFFTTKTREQGTGLGLAIVHGIVTDHGGRIEVDSSPGEGTQVRVLLPLQSIEAPTATAPAGMSEAQLTGSGERILVIDDDVGVRKMVRALLASSGYDPLVVAGGEQALELFARERVDLVLLDEDMPRMKGSECLRRLREAAPELPAVLMSGLRQFGGELQDESTTLLRKPFDIEQLLHALAGLLRSQRTTP